MLFFKKKKKENMSYKINQKTKDLEQIDSVLISVSSISSINNEEAIVEKGFSPVEIDKLPLDFKIDDLILHEITDISLITRINGLVQNGTQQLLHNLHQDAIQKGFESAGELLKSDIPVGQLTKAKNIPGGLRATLMGKNGIEKNAILTEIDSSKLAQSGNVAVGIAKVMNISSMIVGQYYMSQVCSKLVDINKSISSIGDFQQREFKSKIMALINNVEEISRFSSEILENHELRRMELYQLNGYKNDAVQLLEQVNISIQDLTKKNITKILEYQSSVDELEKLLAYQGTLTIILEEISKLIYTLNLGEVSLEKCFSSFDNICNHSNESRILIPKWHQSTMTKLGIELVKNRYKKRGVESFVAKPLLLIDEKWNYKQLESDLRKKILHQQKNTKVVTNKPEISFEDNVELILKDGKYYFVHKGT
ncbi:MAG: hypothetical protein RBQ97_01275 [Acholeplasma sp.]|nr:hypothetical protein [Acholeplasma sp.]